ncbi:hypothetical protein FQN53_002937 [Emmonsiellopsis sp. PD_33]|nr:hypothetical protein FQN53_002937 [Emmonsiellopsis sp. PD_33]
MSAISIATLPRISRETLAGLLLTPTTASKLAIVDVRDSDHIGGHILNSHWHPSSTFSIQLDSLLTTLADKEQVIFHCALSKQRGPSAALKYLREREQRLGKEECAKQSVYVLDGGFVKWQEKYGPDERLTVAWVRDVWEEY